MAVFTIKELAEMMDGVILSGRDDRAIQKFSTNSKEGDETTLFLPIVGERVDAHNFIRDAYEHGIRCTLTMRDHVEEGTPDMTYIHVEQTVPALQKLGRLYRERFTLPLIGITGSVGKTTTKEMIAAALKTKKTVLKTDKNMNSQIGLPQMMTRISKEHDIAVIEMGMSEFGEMERLCKVAQPTFAVMTNIGVSHIGQLKTMENIRSEKTNICNFFDENSVLLVNGDDHLLRELFDAFSNPRKSDKEKTQLLATLNLYEETVQHLKKAKVVMFGRDEECAVYATNIESKGEHTHFIYHYVDENQTPCEEEVELSVLGEHNVLNALAALYIASFYGIAPAIAKEGLKQYQPITMRGEVEKVNDLTIIDDTYNASPDSMKGAINVLRELPKENRKIIVFADILELGEISQQCHYDVGTYLASGTSHNSADSRVIDIVITIGKEAEYIAKGVQDTNPGIKTYSFQTKEEAGELLIQLLSKKDTVLFKGSRGMQLEKLVQLVKKG